MAAAGPYGPVQQRVNWQESLEQGFQSRHAQRLQNRGGRRQRHNEGTSMAAGPSAPIEGRVNYQGRLEQGRGIVTPHQFMGQQERYADEERQHAAHLHDIQLQRQRDHDPEVLQHQAHLTELQWQQEYQRGIEVLQHHAHLAELQEQQDQQRRLEEEQHQFDVDQQQQIHQQEQLEHIQQVMNNNQALRNLPKGCRPYQEPSERHSLGLMNVECPDCHALHFVLEKLTKSSKRNPKFGICCLQGQIQLPPLSEPPPLLHKLLTSSAPRARKFRDGIRQYNMAFAFTSVAVEVDKKILNG
jgi:hypothetical protein